VFLVLSLTIVLMVTMNSSVSAARCRVSSLHYSYPSVAAPSVPVDFATSISGSCASDGEDYYAVRVDLTDLTSNLIISSSDTPIGYNASMFNVTGHNTVTTPPSNMSWPVQIHVYVIRAGGTSGQYLLDYQNSTTAIIQVGPIAVPEFHLNPAFEAFTLLTATLMFLKKFKGMKVRVLG